MTTATRAPKAVGDISSVFPSLSGLPVAPLPPRFKFLKQSILEGREDALQKSWTRLLEALREEVNKIKQESTNIIPVVTYSDVKARKISPQQLDEIRHRGAVVIRGVLPASEVLKMKEDAVQYIAANRSNVSAFPKDDPAVYELYWTPGQVKARAHPDMLNVQTFLNKLWYSSDPDLPISTSIVLTYADRFRIRNPGDSKFALGPHSDGGSLERWEDPEYRRCFSAILEGRWEEYDPFDAKHRVAAVQDLYNGAGSCSMLRFWQGWLSMSSTGPGEGSLKICPLLKHATAYLILRPFFTNGDIANQNAEFPGSVPGASQEYDTNTHPELDLDETMCSVPHVEPGDYVAWHCDAIHSVDKEHTGSGDSSVMYIPACPLTAANVDYLKTQREAADALSVPPDFPGAGGSGEQNFHGAVNWDSISESGLRAMGKGRLRWNIDQQMSSGEKSAIEMANQACFGSS